jgi:acyl-CoA thioesterase-1
MRSILAAVLVLIAVPPAWAAGGILVMGDSLSAAYGVPAGQGWVDLLEGRLASEGRALEVVNASVSGETTQGGATRIDDALARHAPSVVVLELGANDGLRGQPLDPMRSNLAAMIARSREAGARVLLLGVQIPPNYGPEYTRGFEEVFARLHRELEVAWVPFFLDGVALDPGLMQRDGIHPTSAAQPRLLDNVWPVLAPLLEARRGGS